jgi:hypothetical protein
MEASPVIAPGVARAFIVTANVLGVLGPTQALLAVTLTFPLVALHAKSTVTEVVPCPEVTVPPVPVYDHAYDEAPDTAAIEYVIPVLPCAMEASPVITPGWVMVPFNVIARVLGVPAPIQALLTVTLILPFAAPQPKSTRMAFVPWPEEIVAPAGIVHVYTVAPLTNATEYGVDDWPNKGVVVPVIAPGVARVPVMVMASVLSVLCMPQELLAFTVILPLVDPQAKFTIMEFVPCPEVIVAPVPV